MKIVLQRNSFLPKPLKFQQQSTTTTMYVLCIHCHMCLYDLCMSLVTDSMYSSVFILHVMSVVFSILLQPWHMSAAALNAFHNVWLRQATNNSSLRLTINNHPLPRTLDAEVHSSRIISLQLTSNLYATYEHIYVCMYVYISVLTTVIRLYFVLEIFSNENLGNEKKVNFDIWYINYLCVSL